MKLFNDLGRLMGSTLFSLGLLLGHRKAVAEIRRFRDSSSGTSTERSVREMRLLGCDAERRDVYRMIRIRTDSRSRQIV